MTLLTVFVGIIAFSSFVLLIGVAALAFSMKRLMDTDIKPLLDKANALMTKVDTKAETIMDIGEDTARKVSGAVAATTDTVEDAVVSPILGLSSLFAGITKAVETFRSSRGASAEM